MTSEQAAFLRGFAGAAKDCAKYDKKGCQIYLGYVVSDPKFDLFYGFNLGRVTACAVQLGIAQ